MSTYITLDSAKSVGLYKNKAAEFTNKLPHSLYFSKNAQVALVEISYFERLANPFGYVEISDFFDKKNHKIQLHAFEGEPIHSFLMRLNRDIKKAAETIDNNPSKAPEFVHNVKLNTFSLKLSRSFGITFSGHVCNILGIDNPTKYETDTSVEPKLIPFSFRENNINIVNIMYIYSDIIEEQFVGDVKARLLRNVVTQKKFNEHVCINFNKPHYININATTINSINIKITDTKGELIKFSEFFNSVLIKLHIKDAEVSTI